MADDPELTRHEYTYHLTKTTATALLGTVAIVAVTAMAAYAPPEVVMAFIDAIPTQGQVALGGN